MIKVNLTRSVAFNQVRTGSVVGVMEGASSVLVPLKILVILLFPAGLFFYQHQNISHLNTQLRNVNNQAQQVQTELKKNAETAEALKQLTQEKKRLEEQMEAIRKLNKNRLRAIKALDTLQALVPDGVWLQKMTMDEAKVQVSAAASTSDDISLFVKRMEESVYFTDVLMTSTTEESSVNGSFKKFELSCGLGEVQ